MKSWPRKYHIDTVWTQSHVLFTVMLTNELLRCVVLSLLIFICQLSCYSADSPDLFSHN